MSSCSSNRFSSKQQILLVAAILASVCLYGGYQYTQYNSVAANQRRQHSVQLKDGHGFSDQYTSFNWNTTCINTMLSSTKSKTKQIQLPKVKTKPIWVASFPGSGAELFRDLVTSITGQPTVDGTMNGKCRKGVVTCKTHWPTTFQSKVHANPLVKKRHFHRTAMVLLRNPAAAIPSWYNQIWEARVHAEFHSSQAPEKNWNRFRGKRREIERRLQQWKAMILYWAYSEHYHVGLFVPFESLIDSELGPAMLEDVADVLTSANVPLVVGVDASSATTSTPPSATLACFWNETVQNTASMKRSHHKYKPGYSAEQQQSMLSVLDDLLSDPQLAQDRPELMPIFQGYVYEIQHNLRIIVDDP